VSVLDTALIQAARPGVVNASLGGIPLRLNPLSVSLSYSVKTSQTNTVGGMVVQVYGVTLSDLVVEGVFGAGGPAEQQTFFAQIQALAQSTVTAQQAQPDLLDTGDGVVFSTGSINFSFPLLGYDLQVFIKSYTSKEGTAVVLDNTNFNPSWSLTLLIENDNTGLVTTTAADQYINRVAAGLGAGLDVGPTGITNPYIATTADPTAFLSQYGNGATTLSAYIATIYGAAGGATGGSPATASAAAPTTSTSGNEATVWNYLANKGVSAIAIAGFMGNFQVESGFNPQAENPGTTATAPSGPAYGLAQWLGGRQTALVAYATQQGQPVDSLALQLDYLWTELTGSYASSLSAAEAAASPSAAADVVNKMFEGSGTPSTQREAFAQTIYATYAKTSS
jgi:hypothetical protein